MPFIAWPYVADLGDRPLCEVVGLCRIVPTFISTPLVRACPCSVVAGPALAEASRRRACRLVEPWGAAAEQRLNAAF
jgi:hypothetical protein